MPPPPLGVVWYLLVRDKGHDKYSLPGGSMEDGEAA